VGATLTIPLWTGGRIEADVQAAKVRIQQAQQQRRNVELQVAQEVKQAQVEAEAALVGLRSAEEAVQASRTSVELARLRFTSGIATNLDTITAQGALAAAEDVAIRTRYEYFLARARYARAVGDVYLFFE
jgi:outer membrane protein TolC